ncbi:MAG: citrate synthase/methylcitrate synthase [candidate division WOR-3 bacterium]
MNEVKFSKGLEGIPAAETVLTYIDGQEGKLYYLGIPIEEWAEKSTYEEVALSLLLRRLPTKGELMLFDSALRNSRDLPEEVIDFIYDLPPETHPMAALRTVVSLLESYDEDAKGGDLESKFRISIKLIAKFPTIVAYFDRIRKGLEIVRPNPSLNHAANFLYMLRGEKPSEYETRVMDIALILHADHEMNASTFTSMVIASTLSDMYSAITGGVGALKGPLHGGANEEVLKMFEEIGSEDNVQNYIENALSQKKKIMGFGHRVYKAYDPRAKILKRIAESLSMNSKYYKIAVKVEEYMMQKVAQKGIFPNVDFYSGIVYNALGISSDLFTPIFAISRVAGWCAHILEYLEDNRIFRPSVVYKGELDKPYIPIDQR